MRKRLFCALAAAVILLSAQPAIAAAGGSSDPIISLSYVLDTFLPAMKQAIAELISARETPEQFLPLPSVLVAVSAGDSVSLGQGQTFLLTSGSANMLVDQGSVVNVSTGDRAYSGAVRLYQRYIVCEDSAVTVNVTGDAVMSVAGELSIAQGDGRVSPFSDVQYGNWYYNDVINAYDRGLVDGMTESTFVPDGTLTVAQCVKLAACMHQLYTDGAVTLSPSTGDTPWYRSYVNYALKNGIITQEFDNYDTIIARGQFVYVFYNALPQSEYAVLNDIADGAVPDVAVTDAFAREIYAFYRAGILAGYTNTPEYQEHAFAADTTISRAEVAAIMSRMFDAGTRIEFEIP